VIKLILFIKFIIKSVSQLNLWTFDQPKGVSYGKKEKSSKENIQKEKSI